jgi:hypothetical protein
MNILFLIVRKSVVFILIFICTFTALYVPQPWSNDIHVEAGGWAREITQQLNRHLLTSTAANTLSSATSEALLAAKELELDGLAWMLGKRLVSLLLADLTDWINSGFQGSPTFVRDLPRYLQEAADQTFGEYIENLDSLSFLCSPFELDVNIALQVGYMRARTDRAPACTLTDISDNIDGFLSGNFGGDSGFGWQEWFQITAQPETYTPYGSFITAQTGLDIAISSRERDRLTLLDFGNGFMSSEVCRTETGPGGTREVCEVSTPGKIVQEALSFNLDSGRESLVAADEVDEVIGALIDQLTQMALGGMQSIFGLSESDGPGTTRGLRGEVSAGTLVSMTEALRVAREYLQTANQMEPCVAQSLSSSQQVTVLNARRI